MRTATAVSGIPCVLPDSESSLLVRYRKGMYKMSSSGLLDEASIVWVVTQQGGYFRLSEDCQQKVHV